MSDYATKADLDGLEQRIDGKLDGLEQRIDGKLVAMEQRIDGKLDALEQRIEGKLDAMEERINDRIATAIQDSETRLLRAIYSLVESVNKRMDGFEQSQSNVISRLSILETRITEVEKRLNMPPAPAA